TRLSFRTPPVEDLSRSSRTFRPEQERTAGDERRADEPRIVCKAQTSRRGCLMRSGRHVVAGPGGEFSPGGRAVLCRKKVLTAALSERWRNRCWWGDLGGCCDGTASERCGGKGFQANR